MLPGGSCSQVEACLMGPENKRKGLSGRGWNPEDEANAGNVA